ncbi:MAG: hypothetical protein KY454_01470 [Actinobacteria bacterium]|nr:hypothetical protein [Actinomycetota bacterium]MBW3651137.1 hypothetical protein [Actinomycetota bacterium]
MTSPDAPLFELPVTDGVTLRVTDPALADELPRIVEVAKERGEPDLASAIEQAISDYVARVATSAFAPIAEESLKEPVAERPETEGA